MKVKFTAPDAAKDVTQNRATTLAEELYSEGWRECAAWSKPCNSSAIAEVRRARDPIAAMLFKIALCSPAKEAAAESKHFQVS